MGDGVLRRSKPPACSRSMWANGRFSAVWTTVTASVSAAPRRSGSRTSRVVLPRSPGPHAEASVSVA